MKKPRLILAAIAVLASICPLGAQISPGNLTYAIVVSSCGAGSYTTGNTIQFTMTTAGLLCTGS